MKKRLRDTLLFGIVVLALSGCATLPSQREPAALAEYLPDDGMVYLRLRPSAESADLWELLLSGALQRPAALGPDTPEESTAEEESGSEKSASEAGAAEPSAGEAGDLSAKLSALMERTDDVYMALRRSERVGPESGDLPDLEMAAVGGFPPSAIALGLGKSEEWSRKRVPSFPGRTIRTPRVYWQAPGLGLEICLLDRHLLFLATGEVLPMIRRYGSLDLRTRAGTPGSEPQRLRLPAEMLRDSASDIAVYLPDFHRIPFLPGAELPVQDVYIEVRAVEGGYTFPAVFTLEKEDSAKAFNLAFRLFLLFLMKEGEIQGGMKRLGSVETAQEGLSLRVEGLVLTAEELSSLVAAVRLMAGG
jgi:hypothetical protein